MKINSHNEWDPLREVVLGVAEHFCTGLEFASPNPSEALIEKAAAISKQARPTWYVDEVKEDLEGLLGALTRFGAKVHRPKGYGAERVFHTPDWSASGKDLYNARDLQIIVGNTLIVGPSSTRCRYFEPNAFTDIWYHYFDKGFRWIVAPKPALVGDYLIPYYPDGEEIITEEDVMHRDLSGGRTEKYYRLREDEILFDAAGCIRMGTDIVYLISSTGNAKGAQWLQSALGDEYRVHTTSAYKSSHIDSTILPLRPGLVLLNSARVTPESCPPYFTNWDKIYFRDVAPVPSKELTFQKDVRDKAYAELLTLGVESDLNHISSPWAGLNVLSADPHTILVHDLQTELIKELEKRQFTVIPIQMRHCYTMLGGLHCATLDTVRDGHRETYT